MATILVPRFLGEMETNKKKVLVTNFKDVNFQHIFKDHNKEVDFLSKKGTQGTCRHTVLFSQRKRDQNSTDKS